MSDLSNLLGDVYGAPSSDGAPARRESVAPEHDSERADPRAPEWSSQSRLDQAFDGWVPGEPPAGGEQRAEALAVDAPRLGAPAPARPAFQAPTPVAPSPAASAPVAPMPPMAPVVPAPTPAASAARTWTAAPSMAPAAPVTEMAVVAPAPVRSWLVGDDDILPAGKKAKRKK